jgi:hypothetical protein
VEESMNCTTFSASSRGKRSEFEVPRLDMVGESGMNDCKLTV